MSELNWKRILPLSLFGPAMGGLTVAGVVPPGAERYVWFGITLFCAYWIAVHESESLFGNGAVAGFIAGTSSKLIQGIFCGTYTSRNPEILVEFADKLEGFDLQFFILKIAPFVGIAYAFIVGLFSVIAGRVINKRNKEE